MAETGQEWQEGREGRWRRRWWWRWSWERWWWRRRRWCPRRREPWRRCRIDRPAYWRCSDRRGCRTSIAAATAAPATAETAAPVGTAAGTVAVLAFGVPTAVGSAAALGPPAAILDHLPAYHFPGQPAPMALWFLLCPLPRSFLEQASPERLFTFRRGLYFHVWGCLALVCETSADKLFARAVPCVFLGFP
ncbi:unnamed protein product, partial [Closterium sp. NIES-54]